MKITFFSTQTYDKEFFLEQNKEFDFQPDYIDVALDEKTGNLIKKSVAFVCL